MTVYTEKFVLPPIDRREVMRYAGARTDTHELYEALDRCIEMLADSITPSVCYISLPLSVSGNSVALGALAVESASLAQVLRGCESAILFAATVGIGVDRLVMRCSAESELYALLSASLGAERIECLCDRFEDELKKRGMSLTRRFSPGYGDLPIKLQRDIFAILEPQRHIGLTLSASLLMSPTKSVTAIIGIRNTER